MRRQDIDALVRIRRGDHHAVASRVLFQHKPALDRDESEYLWAHLRSLDVPLLARWLALAPERPSVLVAALCEQFGPEGDVLLWHVLRWAERIDRDAWADLCQQLAPRLSLRARRAMLYRARGCPSFDAMVAAEASLLPYARAPLALEPVTWALLERRYDDGACLEWMGVQSSFDDERARVTGAVLVAAGLSDRVGVAFRPSAEAFCEALREQRAGAADRASAQPALRVIELDAAGLFTETELDAVFGDAPVQPTDDSAPAIDRAKLEWLSEHGAGRKDLVALALEQLARGGASEEATHEIIEWLAAQLRTRSAWEQHGARVLGALLTAWRWDLIGRMCAFFEAILRDSSQGDPSASREGVALLLRPEPPLWAPAAHEALGRALVARALEAIEDPRDEASVGYARSLLEALVRLELPRRMVSPLRTLAERAASIEHVAPIAELHAQLCRRGDPEVATLDGILAALRDLCIADPALAPS
ncbi:MAG: hypothetical protein JNK05_39690 [Myxococcales bacterium]|nr:hypothetical protein [Myxococcales bacterium]